jgi:hypothetical protein
VPWLNRLIKSIHRHPWSCVVVGLQWHPWRLMRVPPIDSLVRVTNPDEVVGFVVTTSLMTCADRPTIGLPWLVRCRRLACSGMQVACLMWLLTMRLLGSVVIVVVAVLAPSSHRCSHSSPLAMCWDTLRGRLKGVLPLISSPMIPWSSPADNHFNNY